MKILILEDNSHLQKFFLAELEEMGINALGALSVEEAESLFGQHPDVKLIVVDACVPGSQPTTMPFVKKVRAGGYKSTMIAMSSHAEYRRQLLEAGCNEACEKGYLISKIKNLLAINQPAVV